MIATGELLLSKFANCFNIQRKTKEKVNPYYVSLKESLRQTKEELDAAINNFNNVTDPVLIDTFIYKILSEQSRYEKILSEIKSLT